MALALADSIADVGWDLNDQVSRYVAWWRTGAYSVNGRVFDIGMATSAALVRFLETGDAWTSGDTSPRASGKGGPHVRTDTSRPTAPRADRRRW